VSGGTVTFPIGVSVYAGYDATVDAGAEPEEWIVTTKRYQLAVWRAREKDGKTPDEAADAFMKLTSSTSPPETWKAWKTPGGYAAKFDIDSGITGHTFYGEMRKTFGTLGVMCQVTVEKKGLVTIAEVRKARDDGLEACDEMKQVAPKK